MEDASSTAWRAQETAGLRAAIAGCGHGIKPCWQRRAFPRDMSIASWRAIPSSRSASFASESASGGVQVREEYDPPMTPACYSSASRARKNTFGGRHREGAHPE